MKQVANKLYLLSYVSEDIEQFAKNMLLSVVDQHVADIELSLIRSTEQRTEENVHDFLLMCLFLKMLILIFSVGVWEVPTC